MMEENKTEGGPNMIQGKISEQQQGELPSFKLIRDRKEKPSQGMAWLLRVRIFLMMISLGAVIWTIYKLR